MNYKFCLGNPRPFLVAISISLLCIFQPGSARSQEPVRVYIGNSDCRQFDVPGLGDTSIPLWMELPHPIGGGTMTLYKDNVLIPEWLGVNFFYPWQYSYSINNDALRLQIGWVENPLGTLIHVANFVFSVNADPSQYGQAVQAISVGRLLFSDTTGYSLFDVDPCVSSLCIECATSAGDKPGMPEGLSLKAYPNPFNSSTEISFTLARGGYVDITIFDILGRRVKSFELGKRPAGVSAVTWFGDNSSGNNISSGVYFCRLECDELFATVRLVMLK